VDGSVRGVEAEGLAWLALAAFFGGLAALVFRTDRDFSMVLWGSGAVIAAIGFAAVLDGTWLVLAWSATAAALAVVGAVIREDRLAAAAGGNLGLALVYTLGDLAAPRDFFRASDDPAAGVPSLAFVVAAALVCGSSGSVPRLSNHCGSSPGSGSRCCRSTPSRSGSWERSSGSEPRA
jgi:hypothetical protein